MSTISWYTNMGAVFHFRSHIFVFSMVMTLAAMSRVITAQSLFIYLLGTRLVSHVNPLPSIETAKRSRNHVLKHNT